MQPISASQLSLVYPAPIPDARLEWLCQPERIEHTLRQLYYLNFWKKAHQHLLYADRQGLYEVQTVLLEKATALGVVQPAIYLDGTHRFPGELLLDSVAENAARGILIHLKTLIDPDIWPPFEPNGDRLYKRFIRPLYKRILGKDFRRAADAVEALEKPRLRGYLQEQLTRMIERAKRTRQALPTRSLASLCIAPIDLLPILDNRICFLDSCDAWEDLDISDQRKLDPEGYSEIAFHYIGANTEFVFHLPFRWAEMFVEHERLYTLQCAPGVSVERGIYQGQEISIEESQRHPAKEILQDLGADIQQLCPHELLDKGTYLAKPAIRDILWPTRFCEQQGWEDDPWDNICLPHHLI